MADEQEGMKAKISAQDLDISVGTPRTQAENLARLREKLGDEVRGMTLDELIEHISQRGATADKLSERVRGGQCAVEGCKNQVTADPRSLEGGLCEEHQPKDEDQVNLPGLRGFVAELTALARQYRLVFTSRVKLERLPEGDSGGYSAKYDGEAFSVSYRKASEKEAE